MNISPNLSSRKIQETEIVSDNEYSPVGFLKLSGFELVDKPFNPKSNNTDNNNNNNLSINQTKNDFRVINLDSSESRERVAYKPTNKFKKSLKPFSDHIQFFHFPAIYKPEYANFTLEQQIIDQFRQAQEFLDKVYYIQIYLKHMTDFQEMNKIYCEYFAENPPSRCCVQTDLQHPNQRVAIEFALFEANSSIPSGLLQPNANKAPTKILISRSVLHVASVSQWAPACIGPYAQCNILERQKSSGSPQKVVFLAGQIPLVPETMTLDVRPIESQVERCLKNCKKVLKDVGSDLDQVFHCNIFLTHWEDQPIIEPLVRKALFAKAAITVVQVQVLPRNAPLELQMIAAHTSALPCAQKLKRAERGERGHPFSMLGFKKFVGVESGLLKTFSELTEVANAFSLSSSGPDRVYYSTSKLDEQQLKTAVALFPQSSWIPVVALSDGACCFFESIKLFIK